VRGISVREGDVVVGLSVVSPEATLLVASENGIGKRTHFEEYRVQGRGGKGIITMKTTEKTGQVIGALTVASEDELMLITTGGQMIRTRVQDVRETGRNTQGVKLMDLDDGDRLQAIARVIADDREEDEDLDPNEGDPSTESTENPTPDSDDTQPKGEAPDDTDTSQDADDSPRAEE